MVFLELPDDFEDDVRAEVVLRTVSVEALGESLDLVEESILFFHPSRGALSGMPSHLELTLGTLDGSFCCATAASFAELVLFKAACFFCNSANSRKACWEGSLSVKNAKTFPRLLLLSSWGVMFGEALRGDCGGLFKPEGSWEVVLEVIEGGALSLDERCWIVGRTKWAGTAT